MERFYLYLPEFGQFAVLALIARSLLYYLPKIWGVDNFKDKQWIKRNLPKSIIVGTLGSVIYAPIVEEMLFRAPLIIAFSDLNGDAYIGIVISATLFGLIHYKDDPKQTFEGFETLKNTVSERVLRMVFNFSHAITAGCLGAYLGYIAVSQQSYIKPVLYHAVWNIGAMFVLPLVIALITLLIFAVWMIIVHIRYRFI